MKLGGEYMYTYNKKILFSDIDQGAKMSLAGIMNAMQDCVNINSESIGKGIDYLLETKRTWFAINWYIEINRYPKMFEDVVVKTWPYDFSSSMGFRNVIMEDMSGQVIVAADSIWTLVDLDTGRPIRITEDDTKGYDLEDKYSIENPGRKIKLPNEFELIDTVAVKKSDIDYNGHMSNGKYIQLADEYVPVETHPSKIRVEYKSQSKLGEILEVYKACQENRTFIKIQGKDDGSVKAVVELV
ncbi:MAG: hypothetical protein E7263_08935 [Lachnospiraceae bacterium]|nr:hypothetical protein [Lachnospiraceae bacterium]